MTKSLSKIIAEFGQRLSPDEIISLKKAAKEYRDDGLDVQEANEAALSDIIEEIEKEKSDILKQAQGG